MQTAVAVAALLLAATGAPAQKPGQVDWSVSLQPPAAAPGAMVQARLEARLQPGWHLYSGTTPAGIPLSVKAGGVVEGARLYQQAPARAFDPNFNADTETYEGKPVFLVQAQVGQGTAAGAGTARLALRYQTCNDKLCVPGRATVETSLMVDPAAPRAMLAIPAGYAEATGPAAVTAAPATAPQQGMTAFLLVAFGFGLAALFTPCVFPMIPITMSFFLSRPSGTRRESIFQAAVFCLGIVVLFSGLGLAITAILGPFGVVQLGSNPWVNGFIALVFLAFGLSLLGAFEITVPSAVLTRLDRASQGGGIAGTLLMGLTFSLTSFACVGPFVGTLLAASVQSGGMRPLAGMVAFASGLALPFFLLALFPSYLKRLPRSGGWMARVKVVMGFVILAAMLKYLSSVDQVLQWNVLTRERFLAAWVVLFAMPGLYLLGLLRLEGIKRDEHAGLGRLLTGMAFLVFSLSLLPGMFGGRLGELDAYVPAATATTRGGAAEAGGVAWMKNQYREALERARREGKLVFVSFTRLCLHQLPLDERQYVHAAGDCRGHGPLRPGGAIHRRHRRGLRGQPAIAAEPLRDGGDSVLRHPGPGWQGGGRLPRANKRPRRVPGLPEERRGGARGCGGARTGDGRRSTGRRAAGGARRRAVRRFRAGRQSRGSELLGDVVRAVH